MKMIESCMEVALKQTKEVLEGVPQTPSVKIIQELAGLREQIKGMEALAAYRALP